MHPNTELETWRLLWQAEPDRPAIAGIRDQVVRETRRRTILLAAPILVTIGIGGWVATRALSSGRFEDTVLALETWLFIVVLWAASLWIDRGTWRPLGDSTSAFLDLAIRRCRSTLAGVRFGMVVYPVQLLSVIGWRIYAAPVEPMALVRSWPIVILGWVGVPVVFALAVWYSRRKRAELERLIQLRMQVQRD